MSGLLIQEPPLQVLPSLACKVGLNEAIILQQFHYWLQRSNNIKDGHKWIYNSITNWTKQFPFWSRETVKRTINSLEKQGYLITANYNKARFDKTKWYRINYEKMCMPQRLGQNDPTNGSICTNGKCQNDPTNTNRIPETTTENTTKDNMPSSHSTAAPEIVDYLNSKLGTHYKATTRKTQSLIKARMNEGFTVDDFKTVIDNKVAEWSNDERMSKYLRPETLFGTKFESYLNQQNNVRKTEPVNDFNFD